MELDEVPPPKVYTPCAHEDYINKYGLIQPRNNLTHDGKWCFLCCPVCISNESLCSLGPPFTQYKVAQSKHMRVDHAGGNKHSHEGNGKPKGAFAFTLTKSPNDDLTEEDMISAVRKLMAYKSYEIKRYAWYLEHIDGKDHPHIHGMYELSTQGQIENKFFKRAWPIWDPKIRFGQGFRGGYHRPVRDGEQYDEYIAKQDGIHDFSK